MKISLIHYLIIQLFIQLGRPRIIKSTAATLVLAFSDRSNVLNRLRKCEFRLRPIDNPAKRAVISKCLKSHKLRHRG